MTETTVVYVTGTSATEARQANPLQDLQRVFPWTATSTESADQAWFWTADWQAGEREVDRDIAAGNLGPVFESVDDFLKFLES